MSTTKPLPLHPPKGHSMIDELLHRMKCFDCIVGAIFAGITAYYFIPGASNTTMAVQIAGASYVGSVLGGYIGQNYLSSYDPFK